MGILGQVQLRVRLWVHVCACCHFPGPWIHWGQMYLVFGRICPLVPLPRGKTLCPTRQEIINTITSYVGAGIRGERQRRWGCGPGQCPRLIHHLAPPKPCGTQQKAEDSHQVNQVAAPLQLLCQMWLFFFFFFFFFCCRQMILSVSGLWKEATDLGNVFFSISEEKEDQKQFRFTGNKQRLFCGLATGRCEHSHPLPVSLK